jgi:microcystin-dependent protein
MTTLVSGGGVPVGGILPFGGNTAPDGFLICHGDLLNRNEYPELFDVIGTLWGTTSGTNFRIPTTQGLLLRGRASGSGFDPDRNSRTTIQSGGSTGDNVGSYQSHRYKSHNHSQGSHKHAGGGTFNGSGGFIYGQAGSHGKRARAAAVSGNESFTAWTSGATGSIGNSGSNQTVGANVYVNFIIKY